MLPPQFCQDIDTTSATFEQYTVAANSQTSEHMTIMFWFCSKVIKIKKYEDHTIVFFVIYKCCLLYHVVGQPVPWKMLAGSATHVLMFSLRGAESDKTSNHFQSVVWNWLIGNNETWIHHYIRNRISCQLSDRGLPVKAIKKCNRLTYSWKRHPYFWDVCCILFIYALS